MVHGYILNLREHHLLFQVSNITGKALPRFYFLIFHTIAKDTEVPYFRTSVLLMKFFSPPPVFDVITFVESFVLMKKMIRFSRHCEGALFSQDPSLE
jgi:hypothetical protein